MDTPSFSPDASAPATSVEEAVSLLRDPAADQQVVELMRLLSADTPSDEQVQGLARRLGPAVGLPLADLAGDGVFGGSGMVSGVAPEGIASLPGAGSMTAAAAGTGAGGGAGAATIAKLFSTVTAKVIAAAGVGAALWMAVPDAVEPPAVQTVTPVQRQLEVVRVRETSPGPTVTPMPSDEAVTAPEVVEPAAPARPSKAAATVRRAERPSEIQLLQRAQGMRQNRPARVLSVLRRHAELYPQGALMQEREVMMIEALLATGRRTAAQRRADRLAQSHPNSPHLRRVRQLLATEQAQPLESGVVREAR